MSWRSGRWSVWLFFVAWLLTACQPSTQATDFVGKWVSSRTNIPVHIAANGEWELKTDEGSVLQYGLWRYESHKLIWTIRQGGRLMDDPNPVLSVAKDEFRLRELNGDETVFRRVP
jgi:hypothetical protein